MQQTAADGIEYLQRECETELLKVNNLICLKLYNNVYHTFYSYVQDGRKYT